MTAVATPPVRHPNVSIVENMYGCFGTGDMDRLKREIFASDIKWHLPGHHPLSGTKTSADEVIAFFVELVKAGIKVDLYTMIGDDNTVIEVHRGYTTSKGYSLESQQCSVYQIRNGKIAEVQVYSADQHGVDNFFWHVYNLKPLPDRLEDF